MGEAGGGGIAMYRDSDIVMEIGRYWVTRERFKSGNSGFKVWKSGITHSTLCATCGYDGERGLDWCKQFIEGRMGENERN